MRRQGKALLDGLLVAIGCLASRLLWEAQVALDGVLFVANQHAIALNLPLCLTRQLEQFHSVSSTEFMHGRSAIRDGRGGVVARQPCHGKRFREIAISVDVVCCGSLSWGHEVNRAAGLGILPRIRAWIGMSHV